jgi:hypothetical protein
VRGRAYLSTREPDSTFNPHPLTPKELIMRKIAAVLLSGFALSASAYDFSRATVANPKDCPAGSEASVNYKWQGGHFVRDGWVCELSSGN